MTLKTTLLLLTLSLCSQGVSASNDPAADEQPLVTIKDYKFVPQEITIKRGQTLRWLNQEKRQYHSVWFEALGEPEPADYLFPDDDYERKFELVGTFPYRCGPHPEMTGTVKVTD